MDNLIQHEFGAKTIGLQAGWQAVAGTWLPPSTLLAPGEQPPFLKIAGISRDWFLVCDHATNRIPRSLGALGVTAAQLKMHIAWDIGALNVAKRLAARLRAPLYASGYSRLVIDCNRYPTARDAMPAVSD